MKQLHSLVTKYIRFKAISEDDRLPSDFLATALGVKSSRTIDALKDEFFEDVTCLFCGSLQYWLGYNILLGMTLGNIALVQNTPRNVLTKTTFEKVRYLNDLTYWYGKARCYKEEYASMFCLLPEFNDAVIKWRDK